MAGRNQAALLLATLVVAAICGNCSAVTYTVGDTTGWTVPSSASFYSDWASRQTFSAGDVLVFNFPAGAHTVAEVNRGNFDACNTANTIGAVHTSSPTNITLTAGTHYFICTVGSHCRSGNQKLSVTVTGPSAAPAPSGTTPSGSPTVPTAEVPSTTTAPPPNSATSTSVGFLGLMSVAVAAAFML